MRLDGGNIGPTNELAPFMLLGAAAVILLLALKSPAYLLFLLPTLALPVWFYTWRRKGRELEVTPQGITLFHRGRQLESIAFDDLEEVRCPHPARIAVDLIATDGRAIRLRRVPFRHDFDVLDEIANHLPSRVKLTGGRLERRPMKHESALQLFRFAMAMAWPFALSGVIPGLTLLLAPASWNQDLALAVGLGTWLATLIIRDQLFSTADRHLLLHEEPWRWNPDASPPLYDDQGIAVVGFGPEPTAASKLTGLQSWTYRISLAITVAIALQQIGLPSLPLALMLGTAILLPPPASRRRQRTPRVIEVRTPRHESPWRELWKDRHTSMKTIFPIYW